MSFASGDQPMQVTYSFFRDQIVAGNVEQVTFQDNQVRGSFKEKKAYPPNMHNFLLALMEKFELCFPLEREEGVYLVPGLLDANQPTELKKFMGGAARRIQFRYEDVRPPGLLPRFIVRSHTLSEGQPRWLRGASFCAGFPGPVLQTRPASARGNTESPGCNRSRRRAANHAAPGAPRLRRRLSN